MQVRQLKEARLYESEADGSVTCNLCAHRCRIAEGRAGVCQVRENRDGTLYSLVYGKTIARHIDPIEKKPLYHFYPGSRAYSVATAGCNLRCRWCQNADISQLPRSRRQKALPGERLAPSRIVAQAQFFDCKTIAYTYTEPTIFYEYAYDTASLAAPEGISNVFVTNGYMTGEMLEEFHPLLDAANVDLKAFKDETYRRYVGAQLQPVLDSMVRMKELGIWLEVTTLLIPGINDDPAEIRDTARFVAGELGTDTPWHLSAFHPAHEMKDTPPTSRSQLEAAEEIGFDEGLKYVYIGNVPGESNTYCHSCGELLVGRLYYEVVSNVIAEGSRCPKCGAPVPGVGMAGED